MSIKGIIRFISIVTLITVLTCTMTTVALGETAKTKPTNSYTVAVNSRKVQDDIIVDCRQLLTAATNQALNKLEKYALKRGWKVDRMCHIYQKGRVGDTIRFMNRKMMFEVDVTARFKGKKIVLNYFRSGKPSTPKKIKNWLNRYQPDMRAF